MNVSTENNTGKGIHIFSTKSGPLLFLDYVNDKTIHINCDCRRQHYLLFCQKPGLHSRKQQAQNQNSVISDWQTTIFFLDLRKTECILFGPIRNLNKNQGFQFLMQLLPDHYLCKDVDQNVCGEITVNYIIKKVNSKLK